MGRDERSFPLCAGLFGKQNRLYCNELPQPPRVMPALCRASTALRWRKHRTFVALALRGWPGQARPGRAWAVRRAYARPFRAYFIFLGQPCANRGEGMTFQPPARIVTRMSDRAARLPQTQPERSEK